MNKNNIANDTNKKAKIILADYISYTDRAGIPIGHPLKVLRESAELVEGKFDIMYAAHSIYLEKLEGSCKLDLPYKISEGKIYTSLCGKIRQFITSYKNIHKIFKEKDVEYIWFCNVDIFLFFYLFLYGRKCKKSIITIYISEFPKKYQNKIFSCISKKIKLLITTNAEACYFGNNRLNIPDYLYYEKKYEKYRMINKQSKVVCVGGMGEQKDLIGLIEAFNLNGYKLEIVGHFADKELWHRLRNLAHENIEIKDIYLEYDEYMGIIAGAKFCVLPYRKNIYFTKTSGVILESIFVGTIPICSQELLQRWGICGIGYDKIGELEKKELYTQDIEEIIENNNRLIRDKYADKYYAEELLKRL